jgi:hypothetical protein
MSMKLVFTVLILLLAASCRSDVNSEKKEEVLFYTVSTTQQSQTYISDSFNIKEIDRHDPEDTFLQQYPFEVNGKNHWINLFTNEPYAPVDGGYLAFELDTLGIIYAKSTTWISYSRLKSTNDSINDLITKAFEIIILNDKFHNIDLSEIRAKRKTVSFLPPEK